MTCSVPAVRVALDNMTESVIANSQEYQSFRSSVPLKTVSILNLYWEFYMCVYFLPSRDLSEITKNRHSEK